MDINKLVDERGSATVEAAFIIPTIIIVFLMFHSLMQMVYEHSIVQMELNKTCETFMKDTYFLERIGVFQWVEQKDLSNAIESYSEERIRKMDFNEGVFSQFLFGQIIEKGFGLLKSAEGAGKLYTASKLARIYFAYELGKRLEKRGVNLEVEIESLKFCTDGKTGVITVSYIKNIPPLFIGERRLTLRNASPIQVFSGGGEDNIFYVSPFGLGVENHVSNDIEIDQEGYIKQVYVTVYGEKYHINVNCFHIQVIAEPFPVDKLEGLKACRYCEDVPIEGNSVYKTLNGEVFHSYEKCSSISHELVVMSEREALETGYVRCKSCSISP